MKAKIIHESDPKTFAVILDTGDEAVECLGRFAREQGLTASQLTAIGAFSRAVLGYFDWEKKDYLRIPVEEQVEVVAFLGDVAVSEGGKPTLHPHVVLARRDGSTVGGHLLEGHVRPTLEVIVTESPAHLQKREDPETGLALISL
jgi:predicted DNA-binding protein with PD1-like motif